MGNFTLLIVIVGTHRLSRCFVIFVDRPAPITRSMDVVSTVVGCEGSGSWEGCEPFSRSTSHREMTMAAPNRKVVSNHPFSGGMLIQGSMSPEKHFLENDPTSF